MRNLSTYAWMLGVLLIGGISWYGASLEFCDSGPRSASEPFPDDTTYTRASSESSLRLATWNLEWLAPPERGDVPREPEDYRALAEVAEQLDADAIALQEVSGRESLERVFDPQVYAFYLSGRHDSQRVGWAIKRDVAVTRHDDLTGLARLGYGMRRGVDVTLEREGGAIRLLAVHLDAGCASGDEHGDLESCRRLMQQGDRLERWIRERAQTDRPFAVLGDVNRHWRRDDPFWRGLHATAPLVVPTGTHEPRCHGGRYDEHVDHFVLDRSLATDASSGQLREVTYRDVLSERRRDRSILSDHCPIAFEWAPVPSRP